MGVERRCLHPKSGEVSHKFLLDSAVIMSVGFFCCSETSITTLQDSVVIKDCDASTAAWHHTCWVDCRKCIRAKQS
jgi:hypothetical protein